MVHNFHRTRKRSSRSRFRLCRNRGPRFPRAPLCSFRFLSNRKFREREHASTSRRWRDWRPRSPRSSRIAIDPSLSFALVLVLSHFADPKRREVFQSIAAKRRRSADAICKIVFRKWIARPSGSFLVSPANLANRECKFSINLNPLESATSD